MTPKAFDLLLVLAENPGRLLTKEQLMQAIWSDTAVEESNLSYHVFAIRKALGDTAENGLITTVPKSGYRFTMAVTHSNGRGARTAGVGRQLARADRIGFQWPGKVLPEYRTSPRRSLPARTFSRRFWLAVGRLVRGRYCGRCRRCAPCDTWPDGPATDTGPRTNLARRRAV